LIKESQFDQNVAWFKKTKDYAPSQTEKPHGLVTKMGTKFCFPGFYGMTLGSTNALHDLVVNQFNGTIHGSNYFFGELIGPF
jgi:hypothetical protein